MKFQLTVFPESRIKPKPNLGFTLLELLISLVVFSLLSIMAYAGLQNVLTAKVITEAHTERLIRLQTAFTFLQRDIEQASSRSIRDNFGDNQAAMTAGAFGLTLLEFTRSGWRNPRGAPRSNLQRVSYRLDEEKLIRVAWLMVDGPSENESFSRVLLEGVKSLELRYLDSQLQWRSSWPDDSQPSASLTQLPHAIELTITFERMGSIKRVFQVAPGETVVPTGANLAG